MWLAGPNTDPNSFTPYDQLIYLDNSSTVESFRFFMRIDETFTDLLGVCLHQTVCVIYRVTTLTINLPRYRDITSMNSNESQKKNPGIKQKLNVGIKTTN